MALPPLVVSGAVIASTHINAIRNAIGSWSFAVEANGNQLHNVGPFNATTGAFSGAVTITAGLSANTLTTTGAVVAASATINGPIGVGSAQCSGNFAVGGSSQFNNLITALAGVTVTGAVTAGTIASSGAVSGTTGSFSSTVSSGGFTTTGGLVVGTNVAVTGSISCGDIAINGQPLLQGSTLRYFQCESQHLAWYKKTGGNLNYYWRRSDNGRVGGGNETEMMALSDLGILQVTAANPSVQTIGTGTVNTGFRVVDSVRGYLIGINYGGAGIGKFSIYGENSGHQMLVIDDVGISLWIGGALRPLSIDGSGFIKGN